MLRTNEDFLDYAQQRYEEQERKEAVILKHFVKGQRLFTQQELATKVLLITEGITKVFFTEDNDKEFIVEFLGRGEIIGEVEFLRGIPILCSIEALTDVSVYAFSIPYFKSLLSRDIQLNKLLLDTMAGRLIHTSSRASYQQLYTLEHSLHKLFALQSKQEIALSKEDMSAYLGISVRSLNRVLKGMF